MKVKVLEGYNDKNLGTLKKGDVVEMTEDRYNYLSDKNANPYKVVLVEKVEEVVETAKKETKKETAVKKTTKKNK